MITARNSNGNVAIAFSLFKDLSNFVGLEENELKAMSLSSRMFRHENYIIYFEDESGVTHKEENFIPNDRFGYPFTLEEERTLVASVNNNDPAGLIAKTESPCATAQYFANRNAAIEKHVEGNKADPGLGSTDGGAYSSTGSSDHYKSQLIEYIDDIEHQHGTLVAYLVCETQVTKYRGRAGKKVGVTIEKDMVKANWYQACAQYLKDKLEAAYTNNESISIEQYGTDRPYLLLGRHLWRYFSREVLNCEAFTESCGNQTLNEVIEQQKSLGEIVDEILAQS